MNLSRDARLGYLGMWNFCDDGGNHPASAKTLKAEVFPSDDDLTSVGVQALVDEMLTQGLIAVYEAGGKSYWHVTGWHHQRIEKPTYKHPQFLVPAPINPVTVAEQSPTTTGSIVDSSANPLGALDPGMEGKGVEGNGADEEGKNSAAAEASAAPDSCPHQQIIDEYHRLLPTARRIREWTTSRQQLLRARWREKAERQDLAWWRKFFDYVATSDFLCGRTKPSPGRNPFELSLDWLCISANFVKVLEGAYDNK